MLKFPIVIVDLSVSHGESINLDFIYFAIVFLGVNNIRIVISSWEMVVFLSG